MRLLLDTHALIWWMQESSSLSQPARNAIVSPASKISVSAASAWEIATKLRLGKLRVSTQIVEHFSEYLDSAGFTSLPVSAEHGVRAGLLPGDHKDPFDRMLIAQAQAENLAIVSNEAIFDHYGVRRIW